MKFKIHNPQDVAIDESFWKRAFNYAAHELGIEHHQAKVDCFFIPMQVERKIKFKHFSMGATGPQETGAMFYVVVDNPPDEHRAAAALVNRNLFPTDGRLVKTFFHEMTHVKQILMGEIVSKPRSFMWKGEKWDKREYAFAPWEVEANKFSEKSYNQFLRREVTHLMRDEAVNAYHPAILHLHKMFREDDVYRLTQEYHRTREPMESVS